MQKVLSPREVVDNGNMPSREEFGKIDPSVRKGDWAKGQGKLRER